MMKFIPNSISNRSIIRSSGPRSNVLANHHQPQVKADEICFGWSAANPPPEKDWHCVVDKNNIGEFFEQNDEGLWLPKQSLINTIAEKLEGEDNPRFYVLDIMQDAITEEDNAFESFNYFLYKLAKTGVCGIKPHEFIPNNLYVRSHKPSKAYLLPDPNRITQSHRTTNLRHGAVGFSTARGLNALHRDGGCQVLALMQSPRINIKPDSAKNIFGDIVEYNNNLEESVEMDDISIRKGYDIKALTENYQISVPAPIDCYRLVLVNNTAEGVMHGVTAPTLIDPNQPASRTAHQIHLKAKKF